MANLQINLSIQQKQLNAKKPNHQFVPMNQPEEIREKQARCEREPFSYGLLFFLGEGR
jgi:hypothetical protein